MTGTKSILLVGLCAIGVIVGSQAFAGSSDEAVKPRAPCFADSMVKIMQAWARAGMDCANTTTSMLKAAGVNLPCQTCDSRKGEPCDPTGASYKAM